MSFDLTKIDCTEGRGNCNDTTKMSQIPFWT